MVKIIKLVFRAVEKYFWVLCILCTFLGLFVPAPFVFLQNTVLLNIFLMGILFFTCLKIDFSNITRELRQFPFLIYVSVLLLVVMPVITYFIFKLITPEFALGFLIIGAVPAGMAGGALTDLCKGNVSLALTVTLITSLICPLTIPLLILILTGSETSVFMLLKQSGMLTLLIIVPLILSRISRKLKPRFIKRSKEFFTPFSIISLCLMILGAMSKNSETFLAYKAKGLLLLGCVFLFSAFFHLAGYFIAIRRPIADRVALSVNTAYINNGLAIVFAMSFFGNMPEAILPALLIEFPMIIMIVPLKYYSIKHSKPSGKKQEI